MVDDVQDIAAFYSGNPEREYNRLAQNQLEYDLTWRYFDQYLPAHGSILEVGAATGGYTVALAARGYTVTAVDLSATLLDICSTRLAQAGLSQQVHCLVADARDLSAVAEQRFDVVLLMGPLYHLIAAADRALAVQAAYARLRPGGIICTSFISRFGILGDLMRRIPDWIENQAEVRSFLERGQRPDGAPRGGFRGYFAHASELAPLHEALGCETLVVAGVEPAISADDESYNRLQGAQRQRWCDLLYEISREPSTIGASRHLLYIGKRPCTGQAAAR